MRSILWLIATLLMLSGFSRVGAGAEPGVIASWVQYRSDGAAEARVAIAGPTCPAIDVDGLPREMSERVGGDGEFPLICASELLPGIGHASVLGATLPVPHASPERIVVLGDTGCRIEQEPKTGRYRIQDCSRAEAWPWERIATKAAAMHPDLVIHVGDYLYRESACPGDDLRCGGSPSGDGWETWRADLFTPGRPLLDAAPWIVVRGNHEECARAGRGWTRLLSPAPFSPGTPCLANEPPYAIAVGSLNLIILDDADAPDKQSEALVANYRVDFEQVGALARRPSWLLMHRPMLGFRRVNGKVEGADNRTLLAAMGHAPPSGVELLLAGHIHSFEAINYDADWPPQLIVGTGGDTLDDDAHDKAPVDLAGAEAGGIRVASGLSQREFGFLLLVRDSAEWRGEVYDAGGDLRYRCTIARRQIRCEPS